MNYRIEFKGDVRADALTIIEMDRLHLSSRDFRIIKSKAYRMAMDITDGFCRATVYRNGKRCFRYTIILDEFPFPQITQIWSAWPGDNYRTMRKNHIQSTRCY